jgi:hypothetical protein
MKSLFRLYPVVLLSACVVSVATLVGCGKSSGSNPTPSRAKVAIRRLQTDGNNTMLYIQVRREEAGEPFLERIGGNSDTYGGIAETGPDTDAPTGKYSFRAWYPEVVANPPYPYNPPLRGKAHAELLVNGQVKASLDLDISRPNFERDTCSRTITVQVQ